MRRELLVTGALVATLTACGLPGDGRAESIEATRVPYGLLDPTPGTPQDPARPESNSLVTPSVVWVDPRERLVAVRFPVNADAPDDEQATTLLRTLTAGPSEADLSRGLGTALTPDIEARVVTVIGSGVVVEIDLGGQTPSAERLPLAVGQLVLTATSIPELKQVRIISDGEPLEVPLPGGVLTDGPLLQSDYLELLAPAEAAALDEQNDDRRDENQRAEPSKVKHEL